MINPFRPSKYIRVSDVMDMIAERENEIADIIKWRDKYPRGSQWADFYQYKRLKLQENIDLLRSVLKAKLKP